MWAYFANRPATSEVMQGELCCEDDDLVEILPDSVNPFDHPEDRAFTVHRIDDLTEEQRRALLLPVLESRGQGSPNAFGLSLPTGLRVQKKKPVQLDKTKLTGQQRADIAKLDKFVVIDERRSISAITRTKVV